MPECALAIESILREAGFPEGVFQTLVVEADRAEAMIHDDRIRAVTLTGSEPAGRAVGQAAGKELKPSVLELGGSDAFVVLDDADLDAAATVGARARTLNSGQSCIAAKRFIVHTDAYDAFLDRFVTEMDALTVGIRRITDRQRVHLCHEPIEERVVRVGVDDEPLRGDA